MVSAELIGVEKVLSFMQSIRPGVASTIRAEMERQTITLQNKVKDDYLSGGALNVRTGTLKRSISKRVTEADGHYEGIVGTNVKYGRYWEQGFDRKVGAGARGGPKSISSQLELVKYILLHPPGKKHYTARPFLVPALNALAPSIRVALQAAVAKAVGK